MPSVAAATPEPTARWFAPALAIVAAVTLARVVLLAFNRTDLFVDEAQYWLWGQEMALGYYSKPPMIAWVIRAFTEVGGSDSPLWIRLPGPLLHGITAMILAGVAAHLAGGRAAVWTAAGYVTLPMVAVASLLMSTDSVMFPFLAAALLVWLRGLARPSALAGVAAGVALGLAFLSKYAAVYYLLGAGLAASLIPQARPGWRVALAALLAFGVTILPNLAWNLANGLTTVQHTLDNADWVRDPAARAGLNLTGLAEFLGAQFAVAGPVLFAVLLAMLVQWPRLSPGLRMLMLLVALPLLVVCVQAVLSRAYANWAAAAYLAGVVAATVRLLNTARPRLWLGLSVGVNGLLCLVFPLMTLAPEQFAPTQRHIGRVEMSEAIVEIARAENLETIVSDNRDVLAGLFHHARDLPLTLRAMPPAGRAPHHYALRYPLERGAGEVLFIAAEDASQPCPEARVVARIAPESGAFRRHPMLAYRLPGTCLVG